MQRLAVIDEHSAYAPAMNAFATRLRSHGLHLVSELGVGDFHLSFSPHNVVAI